MPASDSRTGKKRVPLPGKSGWSYTDGMVCITRALGGRGMERGILGIPCPARGF